MSNIYRDKVMKMFVGPGVELTAINAAGTRIITREYGELVDFEAGCWAACIGHGRTELGEVLSENSVKLFHLHQFFDNEQPGALVAELCEAAELKGEYKGTFASSGSEAVSLAVSLAEIVTGRNKKLSFSISYLSSSPDMRMPRSEDKWLDLDISECLECKCEKECKNCGKFNYIDFSILAAFVFEPGNAGGLVLCPPEKLITFLALQTRKCGGLIITNEVTTGFGRTGKWFGFQHYDVFNSNSGSPDLITMGKGLGNGYPISGVLLKSEFWPKVKASDFKYVQSHINDPLGCMVARKVVEIIKNDKLVENGAILGQYLRKQLYRLGDLTGGIKEIRGRGLMNVIILEDKYKAKEIFYALLERGFFVGFSENYNLLRFYPPMVIKKGDIDSLCYSLELIMSFNATKKSYGGVEEKKVYRLLKKTYWAGDRRLETIEESIKNSICYCIYDEADKDKLIGFSRVVTDYATMYWLCDVVVDEDYRGRGIGKKLMEAIKLDPELEGLRGMLATRDAFGLYEKYGFIKNGGNYMDKKRTRN